MAQSGKPFHEVEYQQENGKFCPMLSLLVGNSKKEITAYADTGCESGIFVFKEQVEGVDLGTKISDDDYPSSCVMADGHVVGVDEYAGNVYIRDEEKLVLISVIDPKKDLGYVSVNATTPLVGRGFLDHYNVLYKGTEKKIALFKC